jgi:preprotein translocase subunit YajC
MQQYYFLILLALVFVVLIVLPGRQRKKVQAQQQQMQESLKPGTPVMTTAGLHATVASVGDGFVDLEIAPGVVSRYERRAILQVRDAAGGASAAPGAALGGGTAAEPGLPPADRAPGEGFSGPGFPDDGATGTGDGPADRTR